VAVGPVAVLVGVAVRVGVAVGPVAVLVGVAVGPLGVLVGVLVGPPLPDGPGMAALSSRMSSTVASTALLLVAPMRISVTGLLIVSLVLLANGLPNAASPVAR